MLHKNIIIADRHAPHTYEYANAAARTGASGFVAGDLYKVALQLDTNTHWILTATTPTWQAVGVTDHGSLGGLSDNDHPQYVLATTIGAASGIVPLNSSSKIEATYLPSYVDDVLEVANAAALPGTGVTGVIYVTLDDNKTFRWSGSAYVEVSPSIGTDLGYTASTRVLTSSTGTDVTLPVVATSDPGLAPASGGGTANFLRADGTWAAPPGGNAGSSRTLSTQVATAAQTTFNLTYVAGNIDVFLNGAYLPPSDYTASNGTTVVLTTAAALNDELSFIVWGVVSIGDVATANHTHTGVYEPADATILKDADIGATVQAYDAQLDTWAGVTPGTGVATFIATPSSANLAAALTDETGSGSAVFATTPLLAGSKETKTAPAISTGVLTIDLAAGAMFAVSLNAAITSFTLSNIPASGQLSVFLLEFTCDGTPRAVTWTFSSVAVKWAAGAAPTLTSTNGKKDCFSFYTHDAGTTWIGVVIGQNY